MTRPGQAGSSPRSSARYRRRLAPVLDYVRENLQGELTVEGLARVVHFSPFHFHRVFRAVMGETPAVFVRRARLERAAALMRSRRRATLGTIALEVGFGSPSDLSRSFRRHYGIAPSRWDRRSSLAFRDGPQDASRRPPDDLRALVAAADPSPVRVEVVIRPRSTVAAVRVRRPFEPGALDHGYARLRRWLDTRRLPLIEGGLLGLSWDDPELTPPDRIRYDLAAPVPDATSSGDGVAVRAVPPQTVAVAPVEGDLPRVACVWDHLYHDWLPASRWEPALHPAFERYHGRPDRLESGRWKLDACIPLRPLRG